MLINASLFMFDSEFCSTLQKCCLVTFGNTCMRYNIFCPSVYIFLYLPIPTPPCLDFSTHLPPPAPPYLTLSSSYSTSPPPLLPPWMTSEGRNHSQLWSGIYIKFLVATLSTHHTNFQNGHSLYPFSFQHGNFEVV